MHTQKLQLLETEMSLAEPVVQPLQLEKTIEKSSAKARGRRLKSLRMMASLSRKCMETRYGVSAGTLQGWEDGRYGGLTRKGAERFLRALKEEGVNCSLEWLLEGRGLGPQVSDRLYELKTAPAGIEIHRSQHEEAAAVRDELLFFRHRHPTAVDMVVLDDGMSPWFHVGDTVAGNARFNAEVEQVIGHDCIVETKNGDVYLRHIERGSHHGCYNLMCKNPDTTALHPMLYDVEISYAAPVIWVRRPEKF